MQLPTAVHIINEEDTPDNNIIISASFGIGAMKIQGISTMDRAENMLPGINWQ